ncbi:MAG TPA: hypothetical protein VFF77_04495, partial [Holophagaceae bacterium]|nr:hypothetical protein [Holophagaceae bacterium]
MSNVLGAAYLALGLSAQAAIPGILPQGQTPTSMVASRLPKEVGYHLASLIALSKTQHSLLPSFPESGRVVWALDNAVLALELMDRGAFSPHFTFEDRSVHLNRDLASDLILRSVSHGPAIGSDRAKAALMLSMARLGTEEGLKDLARVLYGAIARDQDPEAPSFELLATNNSL